MLAAFGRAVGLGKPKPTLVSKTAKRNNGGNWESPPVAAMPPLGRSPAASFSSNGSRRGSNASTVSAVNAGSRRGSNASAVSTQPAFVIPRGARVKLAAGTLVSNAQTKRANAGTKAYNNQKAANEAYFRTLNERYARKPSGIDPTSLFIGGPSPRSGEGVALSSSAQEGAAANAATGKNTAASWNAPPFSSMGERSLGTRKAAGAVPMPVAARIFGAAPPLPTAAATEAPSVLFGTRVNAPAAAATAAIRASGALAPPLLNKNRRSSRKHSRSTRRRSSRRKTRRSH